MIRAGSSGHLRFALSLLVVMSCFRLAHAHLLWADEDYHIAAALQWMHGKVPYRDFWYDKPPLSAFYYLLIGAHSGWLLRLFDAAYVVATGFLLCRIASLWWSKTEGAVTAILFGFFTTFYLPSAVIPFAADALMMLAHVAAMYCAARHKAFQAGFWCGVAFLANPKALFVLLTCAAWLASDLLPLAGGFLLSTGAAGLTLWVSGAWSGYVEQVWRWGLRYASGSPVAHPLLNGLVRTLNWLGFHVALLAAAITALITIPRNEKRRLLVWITLSFAAVALGSRFAPHYFLQLLPPLTLAASRGVVFAVKSRPRIAYAVLGCSLLLPAIRFGPRYFTLAADDLVGREPRWKDVAMDIDSQHAAAFINARKRPGETLFVWGYRPDLYVYTRLVSDGLFWDSQPVTGVAADRHLNAATSIYSESAKRNQVVLSQTHPTWFVDGLGLLNPQLRPQAYPDIARMLANHYELAGRTGLSLIYRRLSGVAIQQPRGCLLRPRG